MVILCVAGWKNQSSHPSLGHAHPSPYLGSLISIKTFIFFLVEVRTAMELSWRQKIAPVQRREQALGAMEGEILTLQFCMGVVPKSLAI